MSISVEAAIASLPLKLKTKQQEILLALMNGEHVFGVLPTGYGKSVCFGLFGELMDKVHPGKQHISIVICPLKALMMDQVRRWTDLGIKCAAVTSDTSKDDKQSILDCKFNLVFMSPEVAVEQKWKDWVRENKSKMCLLAVDEVHCLTSWGTTFREEYLKIPSVRGLIIKTPVLLLTATVTPKMVTEILKALRLQSTQVKMIATLPDRPNIYLEVQKTTTKNITEAAAWLVPHIRQGKNAGKVIIFCRTMSAVRTAYGQIMDRLGRDAWSSEEHTVFTRYVDMFHSSIDVESQERILSAFVTSDSHVRCVVATVAFGLGVQVADVRYVLHWGPASDVLSYWQEVGRCARDGDVGKATTIIYPGSVSKLYIDENYIKMLQHIEAGSCIRKCIFEKLHIAGMGGFEEACERKGCCSFCTTKFT